MFKSLWISSHSKSFTTPRCFNECFPHLTFGPTRLLKSHKLSLITAQIMWAVDDNSFRGTLSSICCREATFINQATCRFSIIIKQFPVLSVDVEVQGSDTSWLKSQSTKGPRSGKPSARVCTPSCLLCGPRGGVRGGPGPGACAAGRAPPASLLVCTENTAT